MKNHSKKLLEKAVLTLEAAELLLKAKNIENAAGRAYYAMFYVAKALLCEKGFEDFKKHSAVHSAYGEHFSKTRILDPKFHRILIETFDARLKSDYDTDPEIKDSDVLEMLQQAREFLEVARQYLSKAKGES